MQAGVEAPRYFNYKTNVEHEEGVPNLANNAIRTTTTNLHKIEVE